MDTASLTVSVRVRDMKRTKLFVWELHELRSRMVLVGDAFATDLDRIIDRYVDGGDDDAEEEAADA